MKKFNSLNINMTMALILVFTGPLFAALLLYYIRDHLQFKTMNTGALISPPQSIESFNLSNESFQGHWQLLYLKPSTCNTTCQNQIEQLQRIHIALGKDQHRVKLRFESNNHSEEDSVWIIDPQGFMILYYSSNTLTHHPKGLLEDMRRLLRYSHDHTR